MCSKLLDSSRPLNFDPPRGFVARGLDRRQTGQAVDSTLAAFDQQLQLLQGDPGAR